MTNWKRSFEIFKKVSRRFRHLAQCLVDTFSVAITGLTLKSLVLRYKMLPPPAHFTISLGNSWCLTRQGLGFYPTLLQMYCDKVWAAVQCRKSLGSSKLFTFSPHLSRSLCSWELSQLGSLPSPWSRPPRHFYPGRLRREPWTYWIYIFF